MFTFGNTKKHHSDDMLILEYLDKEDMSALDELFQRYSHLVFFVCQRYLRNKEDSKDAVLEIFEKIMGSLRVHKVMNFKSWLYSVAKHHCLMKLRRTETNALIFKDPKEIDNIFMENPDFMHLYSETQIASDELEFALNQLNKQQKECVQFFYYDRLTYQEIGEKTGYDLKQIKSYIQNGKRNLKKILTQIKESPDE
jgi:RNA polymerase sigma factor (sigma-70 family)